jgi:hypothetical protein
MSVRNRIAWIALCLSALPFGLYTYNSGYGYDQLEYLIIGRSLVEGYALYDFVPSKSPGIYLLVASLFKAGLTLGHVELAAVISAVYLLLVAGTFVVAQRIWDVSTAAVAAVLVAACVWFMELNFLQPTGFVYLLGLLGYYACVRTHDTPRAPFGWFACGAAIAVGLQFKSVAAFYGVAAILLVLRRPVAGALRDAAALVLGAAVPSVLALLCVWAAGHVHDYWEWTLYFPLFKYPASTVYLPKLYTKLLFFAVIFSAATLGSLLPRYRRAIWGDFATRAAFVFGAVSLLALLKTQSSHYCFPGAAFLCLFSARVAVRAFSGTAASKHALLLVTGGVAALALMLVSAWLYRPQALARLTTIRAFDEERAFVDYVQRHSAPARPVLVVDNGVLAYWVSHRYPNLPLLHTDVQTTYYLQVHRDALLAALRDPRLQLVEFNPEGPAFDDPNFLETSVLRDQIARFRGDLERNFRRDPSSPAGYTFWIRSPRP